MSTTTKERLLNDLEALRHQLEQIEAYGDDSLSAPPELLMIPTLEVDNIPLLGDVVPANREEAIAAHLEAMAALDAELKILDQQSKRSTQETQPTPLNTTPVEPVISPLATSNSHDHLGITATPNHVVVSNAAPNTLMGSNNIINSEDTKKSTTNQKSQSALAPHKIHASIFQEYKLATLAPVDTRLFNPITPTEIGDDNPFLPQHLRERLNQSKSFLLEGIAKSSESLDASTALLKNFNDSSDINKTLKNSTKHLESSEHQQLIDALVARYLPIIESELRQQLSESLKTQKTSQFTNENKAVLSRL